MKLKISDKTKALLNKYPNVQALTEEMARRQAKAVYNIEKETLEESLNDGTGDLKSEEKQGS